MSLWKTSIAQDGRNVSRLRLPAFNFISDSLRSGHATADLTAWLSLHPTLSWPTIGPYSVNHVILPTSNGAHVYIPGSDDPNFREPFVDGKPVVKSGPRADCTKLLVGATETSVISSSNLQMIAKVITCAFQEFDEEMVKELSVSEELAHLRNYGNHDLSGTVRPARFALGTTLLYNTASTFPSEAAILLKYANQGMDSFFAVRNCDHDRLIGLTVGSLSHTLRQQPRAMYDTHTLSDGSAVIKMLITGGSGAMSVRDGLGLRVGGRETGSGVDEVITNQLEAIRISSLATRQPSVISSSSHFPFNNTPLQLPPSPTQPARAYLSLSDSQRTMFINTHFIK